MTVGEIKEIYMSSRSLRQAAWKARMEYSQMRELRRFYNWPVLRNYKPKEITPKKKETKRPRVVVMSIYEAVLTG